LIFRTLGIGKIGGVFTKSIDKVRSSVQEIDVENIKNINVIDKLKLNQYHDELFEREKLDLTKNEDF